MYIFMKLNGGVYYFVFGLYVLATVGAFISMIIHNDFSLFLASVMFGLLGWLFYTLGKWTFLICTKAENFDRFCEVHKIDSTKTYHQIQFAKYKKN